MKPPPARLPSPYRPEDVSAQAALERVGGLDWQRVAAMATPIAITETHAAFRAKVNVNNVDLARSFFIAQLLNSQAAQLEKLRSTKSDGAI